MYTSLIEEYANGYQMIVTAIEGLTEQELYIWRSEKSWNIKEIIVHLTNEIEGVFTLKDLLQRYIHHVQNHVQQIHKSREHSERVKGHS